MTISTSATTVYSLPSDLYEIVSNTVWSRSENEEAYGPMNSPDWQFQKGIDAVTALTPEWRLEYTQGVPRLVMLQDPGTQVWVLEYRSKNWVVDTSGSATASLWTQETERTQLDEHLFYLQLKWRWLKSKGSDYGHDFAVAETQLGAEKTRDFGSKKLSLGGDILAQRGF